MMTIVTLITVKKGSEPEWDAVMKERFEGAKDYQGWLGGQLAMPTDRVDQRLIIGEWLSRADWEAWHNDPIFQETGERLDALQAAPSENRWYEVVVDGHPRPDGEDAQP